MLVDYEYSQSSKNLILSIIDPKSGSIKLKYYPWHSPTKFIETSVNDPDKHEKYTTWDGKPVKSVYSKYPNKYTVYNFIDGLPQEDQDLIYGYYNPNIFFIDIETEILNSKPEPHLAPSKILSISIVFKNKVLVMGLDLLTKDEQESIKNDINTQYGLKFNRIWEFKYIQYKSEYDMLLNFFKQYVPSMPVMTGWFFIDFDWVFLVNRARKLGIDPSVSSFTGTLSEPSRIPRADGKPDYRELPKHRIIVDYMELFKKWDTSIKVKESDTLDFVSSKLLGIKKVNYEGNLKILYETDFKKFIFYNAIDSVLVQLIHEKQKYIDILYGISVLSRITVTTAFSTLAVTEGVLRKPFKEQKNIVLIKSDYHHGDEGGNSVVGGWVKEPIRGMATWTTCYDFASLYPTTMRQFNISADSYKGVRIKGTDYALFKNKQNPIDPTDIVTINGAVFKNEIGVVNQRLTEIYGDRKKYKKVMIEKNLELERLTAELKELEESLN